MKLCLTPPLEPLATVSMGGAPGGCLDLLPMRTPPRAVRQILALGDDTFQTVLFGRAEQCNWIVEGLGFLNNLGPRHKLRECFLASREREPPQVLATLEQKVEGYHKHLTTPDGGRQGVEVVPFVLADKLAIDSEAARLQFLSSFDDAGKLFGPIIAFASMDANAILILDNLAAPTVPFDLM